MLEMINTRRSVRKFKADSISDQDIREILEAGMNAPSAGNEQPWHFVVLKGDTLQKYLEINKNAPKGSSVGILVCADPNLEKFKGMNLSIVDCSAAVENMLLAVHAKGLGAVWTAVFANVADEVKTLLNLPEHILPFAFLPIGCPAAPPAKAVSRYDESRVHHNTW